MDLVLASVVVLLLFAVPPLASAGRADAGRPAAAVRWDALARRSVALSRSLAEGVLHVYLDPAGSDSADGLSPRTAVRGLARAQQVIAGLRPTTNVEVRVAPGTYVAPPVRWTTYVPGRSITFLPAGYQYGDTGAPEPPRPVFRGDGRSGFWFVASLPPGHAGGDMRLRFYHLQVERYSGGGITFDGGAAGQDGMTRPVGAGHNGNTVYGMAFRELGSKHVPSGTGFGAVDLVNSRHNVIQDSGFTEIENTGPAATEALVHGVYMAHGSTGNVVQDNRFVQVSGDPIRTRNASGDNHVSGNEFVRAGSKAYLSDWFVDAPAPGAPRECPSRGNQFFGNTMRTGYAGEAVRTWSASPPVLGDEVDRGCPQRSGKRVRAWGNRES